MERFSDLQRAIDDAVLNETWDKAKKLLDDLSGVFEASIDAQTAKPLKYFFCKTSAEVSFHLHNDLAGTIDALRRAYAFQNNDFQLKIVAVRVLLITCRASVNFFSTRHDLTQHYRTIHYRGEELSLRSTLGDKVQSLPPHVVEKFDTTLRKFSKIERCCIVGLLETFSIDDVVAILTAFHNWNESKGTDTSIATMKRDLVLVVARHYLPVLDVNDNLNKFLSGSLSTYQYWLVLESVLTRATLAELLEDVASATLLIQSIVRAHEGLELSSLDERILDQILLSVSKLPLLSHKLSPTEDTWKDYDQCLQETSTWATYLPIKVKVGLSVKAAIQAVLSHEAERSNCSRESILRAGSILAKIWHQSKTDRLSCIDALSQSSFTTRSLKPLKISGINVLPDDDTNIAFIAMNFDVSSVSILLAGLIHYAYTYLDMRFTPPMFLSQEFESTFLSFDIHATLHELIEWGYQTSLKPSNMAIWHMVSSYLLHTSDSRRAAELLLRLHSQTMANITQYLTQHEVNLEGLFPVEAARAYVDALAHTTSLEDKELQRALTLLSYPVPSRCLEDPWAALTKYAEIVLSHVCTVTGASYQQTGLTNHWSPSLIDLESCIQHLLDGIRSFGGVTIIEDIITPVGIVGNSIAQTVHHILHTVPFQEGLSRQLLVHGLHTHYTDDVQGLPKAMQALTTQIVANRALAIISTTTDGPTNDHYTAALGVFTLLLQLSRSLFHYAAHTSISDRVSHALQIMAAKLLYAIVTVIDPFVTIPLTGDPRDSAILPRFDSTQNVLAHNNPRYTEFVEVKTTAAFYLSLLYIELHLPPLALKLIREQLQSPYRFHHRGWSKLEIRFLHLLSLAVSASDEGDDPKKLAVAIALLQKVIGTAVLFGTSTTSTSNTANHGDSSSTNNVLPVEPLYLNERYTILLLVMQSGERKLAVTIAERLVADIYQLLQRREMEESHRASAAQDPTGDALRATVEQRDPFARIPFGITMFPDVTFRNDMMVKLVKLLRQLAMAAISLERLTVAKQAVAIAWKTLYTVDARTTQRLQNIATADDARKKSGSGHGKSMEQLAKTHEEIDALRYLPTLLGWRLPEGYGWGCEHHRDLEAALLCTCARIIQQENNRIDDPRAVGLLHLALSHDPRHVETLNALANVSLALYEKDILRKGNPSLMVDVATTADDQNVAADDNDIANHSYVNNNRESFYVKEEVLLAKTGADLLTPDDEADINALPNQHMLDIESSYAFLSAQYPQLASPHLASALFYVRTALTINERSSDSW